MSNTLADAIAKLEGFGQPGAIPTLANNPGSLENGDVGYGTMQAANGNNITIYPNAQAGMDALNNQLSLIQNGQSQYYTPDMSISQFGQIYSGGSPAYNQLPSMLGVSPNAPLASVLNTGSQTSSTQNPLDKLKAFIAGPNSEQWKNAGLGPSSLTSELFSNVYTSRLILLVIGMLLIAAGLLQFKQTQTVIQVGGATAKGAANAVRYTHAKGGARQLAKTGLSNLRSKAVSAAKYTGELA